MLTRTVSMSAQQVSPDQTMQAMHQKRVLSLLRAKNIMDHQVHENREGERSRELGCDFGKDPERALRVNPAPSRTGVAPHLRHTLTTRRLTSMKDFSQIDALLSAQQTAQL